jgi:hypothetical protein
VLLRVRRLQTFSLRHSLTAAYLQASKHFLRFVTKESDFAQYFERYFTGACRHFGFTSESTVAFDLLRAGTHS